MAKNIMVPLELSEEAFNLFLALTGIAEDVHHVDRVAMAIDKLKNLDRGTVMMCNEKLNELKPQTLPVPDGN